MYFFQMNLVFALIQILIPVLRKTLHPRIWSSTYIEQLRYTEAKPLWRLYDALRNILTFLLSGIIRRTLYRDPFGGTAKIEAEQAVKRNRACFQDTSHLQMEKR